MSTRTINIATEFSDTPGGRYPEDGPANGQKFRDELLIPALKSFDKVIVDVSGVEGYGSSFLEEVFGGIIRLKLFDKNTLARKLTWIASDPSQSCYLERIDAYVAEAWEKLK